jgi:prepilin-type N-terminal cleavage/methylation domain-containing protein
MNIKDQHNKVHCIDGFTLMEMIISIMILSILVAGSTLLLTQGFKGYFAAQNVVNPQIKGGLALEIMTRDLRAIRSPADISNATANSLAFVDVDNRSIYYQFLNNQLQRKIGSTGSYQALLNNVQNIIIYYYDALGVVATQNASIRYIVVNITMNDNSSNILTTGVYPWQLN